MSTQTAAVRTTPIVPPGRWIVDPTHSDNSNVEFAVNHIGIASVRGKVTEFEGTLEVGQDLAGSGPLARSRSPRSRPAKSSATPTCARRTSSTSTTTRDHVRVDPRRGDRW
jgi:hypothetical protein